MGIAKGSSLFRCCWLLLVMFSPAAYAEGYSIAAMPGWVAPVAPLAADWVEKTPGSNGVAYLLVDRQWSMTGDKPRQFNHFVTKARSASGVEKVSGISIDFDPVYESLTLHELAVWRGGVRTDRMDRARIDLMQREKELEYQLYDGSLTLNVILEDVRPGDTVEYSYSIEGANPIFAGHFSRRLNLQWSVPVGRLHYRLLWPQAVPLHLKHDAGDMAPITRSVDGNTEYIWLRDRLAAQVSDESTPSWYDPIPRLAMSDMASWDEVVAWALPLYRKTPVTPAEQAVLDTLRKSGETPEQRALAAVSFVQEQIRYLGMEMGESSHKPSLPGEVLERRYGDCKDKVRLLVNLLRELGVEAYPALVNTASGDYLPDALPSLLAFNHVIVQVRLDGKRYWLDPTRTHQAGVLSTIYQPDYDYALVVAETDGGLQSMSDDINVVHGKQVEEVFDITHGLEQPVSYRIETRFDRYYADSLRGRLAETDLDSLQQSYLNYTAHYYPSVEVAETLRVVEANKQNSITLVENYRIPKAWKSQTDSHYRVINFEPFLIDDHVTDVESPKRTAPYAVTHPVSFRHTTRVITPPGSAFEHEHYEINDSAFRFEKSVEFTGTELIISYFYESLRDHVMPADIAQHAKHLRDVYNLSSYQVQMLDPAINFGEYRFDAGDINWLMAGLAALAAGLGFLLCYRFIYLRDPPLRKPQEIDPELVGLSGWLILPGIVLLIFPFFIGWGMRELLYVFSATQWSLMVEEFSTGLLTLIACEVMLNVLMIVASLFVLAMFVTRRRGFAKLFIGFFLFVLAVNGADLVVIGLLSVPGVEVEMLDVRQFFRLMVLAIILGSYFARSRRVRSTFTRSRGGKEENWQGDLATQTS